MKLLHIASFSGNVGDIINHEGFYSLIAHKNVEIDQLEIRKFYKNSQELRFDEKMLQYINGFDGLILGGGGFFDVRWDDSNTGTTFDISEDFLSRINIPVLVNAMGIHIEYNKTIAIQKFESFFKTIICKKNWMVTLRNDGSLSRVESLLKQRFNQSLVVPDNGFAFKQKPRSVIDNIVGLSITNDLFTNNFNGSIDLDSFNNGIAELCKHILKQNNDIVFFIHAPQDIKVLNSLYCYLGNELFRRRIKIAQFDPYTIDGAMSLDNMYSKCKYVIAMRFHGNVIAIKNKIPVIGLAGHEQILGLYKELGLANQCVVVNDGYLDRIIKLADLMNSEPNCYLREQNKSLKIIKLEQEKYSERIIDFFKL